MQERAFQQHLAAVYEAEAAARQHQPEFAATLRRWAANARRRADALPHQPRLFDEMEATP